MAIQQEWHIQSRSAKCAATERDFVEDEYVYSALYWKDGQYARVDLCEDAWGERNDSIAPLSHWKHKFKIPPPPPPEPLRKDDAESILKHLLEENDPEKKNVRYILALMLERKRLLKPIDKQDSQDGPILIYEHLASGDTWIVHDPQLNLAEIGPVQDEVVKMLDEGILVGPAPEQEEVSEEVTESESGEEEAATDQEEPEAEAESEEVEETDEAEEEKA